MSGLNETAEFPGYGPGYPGQVAPRDIDQYYYINIDNPSVDTAWYGAGTSTGTTVHAIAAKNALADWPRNAAYCFTGGTSGGTIVANFLDQFGSPVTETVALGSVAGGGTTYGTAIVSKFLSGTVFPNTSTAGTYTIGNGTATNGSAQSNWFGFNTKIGGTADLLNIRWVTTSTPTAINGGTSFGTLIDINRHAWQGTSGVAITDTYLVTFKPSYDNSFKPRMTNLITNV